MVTELIDDRLSGLSSISSFWPHTPERSVTFSLSGCQFVKVKVCKTWFG